MDARSIVHLFKMLGNKRYRVGKKWVLVSCPFAARTHENGVDLRPSFSVSVKPNSPSYCRCFACDWHGRLWQMLKDLGYDDLLEQFGDSERLSLHVGARRAIDAHKKRWMRFDYHERRKKKNPDWNERDLKRFDGGVPQYILDRGVTLNTCKDWGLGHDYQQGRVVFPLRDRAGGLVGVLGRSVCGNLPRWKTYYETKKSEYLFGIHKLSFSEDRSPIIVVEGPMDVLAVYQAGIENAVALMGCVPSEVQIRSLLDLGQPVVMMLDYDDGGRKGRVLLKHGLKGRIPLFDAIFYREGVKDAGEMNAEEIRECIKNAQYVL